MKHTRFWLKELNWKPEAEQGGGDTTTTTEDTAGGGETTTTTTDTQETNTNQGPDLSFLGEDYVKDGELNTDAFKERWETLVAEEARRAENAPDIPEDGNYDLGMPEDLDLKEFGLPEGVEIQALDPNDEAYAPVFEEAKAFMQEHGIGQTAAKGLMGLVAKVEAAKEAKRYSEATAQYETLGATEAARSARMSSLKRAAETRLPKEQADALLSDLTSSPEAVRALETLLVKNAGPKPAQTTVQKVDPNLRGYDLLKQANAQTPN